MIKDWPTQELDLEIAKDIIDKHTALNDDETLNFIEVSINKENENKFEVKMPEWINDLAQHFRTRYGYEHGYAVTSKILTRFLLKNETVH